MSRQRNSREKIFGDEQIDVVAQWFGVLADPSRLRLVRALAGGPQNVGQLMTATGLRQANVSKHLAVLLQVGLVQRRPLGNTVQYNLVDDSLIRLSALVCGCIKQHTKRRYRCFA